MGRFFSPPNLYNITAVMNSTINSHALQWGNYLEILIAQRWINYTKLIFQSLSDNKRTKWFITGPNFIKIPFYLWYYSTLLVSLINSCLFIKWCGRAFIYIFATASTKLTSSDSSYNKTISTARVHTLLKTEVVSLLA